MKILDIVHDFADGKTRVSRGLCRVRSYMGPSGTVVLMTNLDRKNDGPSVTNVIEEIIKSLVHQGKVVGPAKFVEHYERGTHLEDKFFIVTINLAGKAEWKSITLSEIMALIDCPLSELDERSDQNRRIVDEADRVRFSRNPFIDSIDPEDTQIIKRRLEIIDGMISKAEIESLVSSGAGEQEIQRLLKKDLSIFGEAYAQPDGEYICFSEFPLADGIVDFVVLSGRSRMDVILIEVKGADFNLVNRNHYKDFNHKINQASGQISTRLGRVCRDPKTFRDHVHSIRKRAESGENIHNAFLGPYYKLEVDPAKDINIRTVVIGGRTVDDLEESIKRHDYEHRTVPPIRIESWGTWLRRLQRQ